MLRNPEKNWQNKLTERTRPASSSDAQVSSTEMERYRVLGSVDSYDGQQNLDEWIQMVTRAADFAGWNEEQTFKAAMFRLRGEAGEHAEQLREEGKINTWKELQAVLKERFVTSGKEQWHQYLLNTGTQGTKTVQEWAQTVRKLSLLALAPEMEEIKMEGVNDEENQDEQRRQETGAKKEARKKLLDYMRKSNFVRGLKSSLRQMVWRKKCKTFDEAVQAAAEEEAVEASHREEEVLSCYKRDIPSFTNPGLVEQLVAALEIHDAKKKKEDTDEETTKTARGGLQKEAAKKQQPRNQRRPIERDSEDDEEEDEEEEEEYERRLRQRGYQQEGTGSRWNGRNRTAEGYQQYDGQVPLPRASSRSTTVRQWTRRERSNEAVGNGARPREYGSRVICFYCNEAGHIKRFCPHVREQQSGNEYRRLPGSGSRRN